MIEGGQPRRKSPGSLSPFISSEDKWWKSRSAAETIHRAPSEHLSPPQLLEMKEIWRRCVWFNKQTNKPTAWKDFLYSVNVNSRRVLLIHHTHRTNKTNVTLLLGFIFILQSFLQMSSNTYPFWTTCFHFNLKKHKQTNKQTSFVVCCWQTQDHRIKKQKQN